MHLRPTIASILVLALVGCGGSDSRRPAELTGTLHGGHIQGVEWRTPSRSGTTDVNGGFTYLPGESVAFSLGDVELGTAPGSSDITLFTLAGLTPPTTERALRGELDRAMRTSTPFTRATNLDLLLLALDADGNPDNGLDVRNRGSSLKGVSLDFDQGIFDFYQQLYTTVPALIQSIPMARPVAHLYSSLGLRVSVHAPTRVVTEGLFRLLPSAQTFSYYLDGALQSDDSDQNGDGVVDLHTGYEYGPLGRTIHQEQRYDYDFDHVDDVTYVSSEQFDARGRVVGGEEVIRYSQSGPRQLSRLVENAFDDFGRITRQVMDRDTDGDGVVDARDVGVAVYDGSRLGGTYVTTTDNGLDGVADRIVRTSQKNDARGRPLSSVTEIDDGADGIVDSRYGVSDTYDDVARTVRTVYESDEDADGKADRRDITVSRLDRAGNVVEQTSTYEGADGFVERAQSLVREFDRDRRVTKSTRDDDMNGDGMPDSRQTDQYVHDDIGNVTWRTRDDDVNLDGRVDSHSEEGSEYGADGELLGSAAHDDWDADGLTDIRTGISVESAVLDDGVLLLTNWYLRNRTSGANYLDQ